MYAKPELLEGFRDILAPIATVLTPNQYEAELLTGIQIHTMHDALQAINLLHALGPSVVVGCFWLFVVCGCAAAMACHIHT